MKINKNEKIAEIVGLSFGSLSRDPNSFYKLDSPPLRNAGMSELGQKSTVEDKHQKPYALVAARVQIPFPAFK